MSNYAFTQNDSGMEILMDDPTFSEGQQGCQMAIRYQAALKETPVANKFEEKLLPNHLSWFFLVGSITKPVWYQRISSGNAVLGSIPVTSSTSSSSSAIHPHQYQKWPFFRSNGFLGRSDMTSIHTALSVCVSGNKRER